MPSNISKYFSDWEFACPCCGVTKVSERFLVKLDKLRELLGKPIHITSGCRCSHHNADLRSQGYHSVDGSAHTISERQECEAADLECSSSTYRRELLILAHSIFNRVGVAKSFIHVDDDQDKDQNVTWTY